MLIDKKRASEILDIAEVFDHSVLVHKDLVSAVAYSAVPLGTAEMDALKAKLTQLTGKAISLENIVDASVIGGIRLKVGDKISLTDP